jgi:hypothetical protein
MVSTYCKPNWKIFRPVVEGPKGYGVARNVSAIRSGIGGAVNNESRYGFLWS